MQLKKRKRIISTSQTIFHCLSFLLVRGRFTESVTRAKFEELADDLIERTKKPVRQALSDAGLSASELDEVILVGGSHVFQQ